MNKYLAHLLINKVEMGKNKLFCGGGGGEQNDPVPFFLDFSVEPASDV